MIVGVIGGGYVGLVTGAGLASLGHRVRIGEASRDRLAELRGGGVPFHEPGLPELMDGGATRSLLTFLGSNADVVAPSDIVFVAVPTPANGDGSADTRIVEAVAAEIAPRLGAAAVLVLKSTVPVGTTERVREILRAQGNGSAVVANPEFLRMGSAVSDFFAPSRIVVGSDDDRATRLLASVYETIEAPMVVTDPRTAELIKYASNAFLATRISFANEIAGLCAVTGADEHSVLAGVGLDPRIGRHYFQPGPGYGGSCLPKDTRAILATAASWGHELPLLRSVVEVNERRKAALLAEVMAAAGGDVAGRVVGIWGLSFKAESDDVRESPAVALAEDVVRLGGSVTAYDPMAGAVAVEVRLVARAIEAAKEADVLVVATEWDEFRDVDLSEVRHAMRGNAIVDARNVLERAVVERHGLVYHTIGHTIGQTMGHTMGHTTGGLTA